MDKRYLLYVDLLYAFFHFYIMKETILIAFGKRLRQLRLESNLSQEKLAEQLGFHRTYVGMVERGERNISLVNIHRIASYFNLSLKDFFKGIL